jgi:hypothetical protein
MTVALGYKFLDFRKQDSDSKVAIQIRGPFVASLFRF